MMHDSGEELGEQLIQKRPWYRDIAFLCVLGIVVLVPLVTSNLSALGLRPPIVYDQTSLPKWAVFTTLTWLGILAWALDVARSGRPVRRPRGWALLLGFLGWLVVTTFTSLSPWESVFGRYTRWEGLVTYLTYAALFFLAVQVVSPARWIPLARAIAWTGIPVAAYGLLQVAGVDPTDWLVVQFESARAFSTYGNPEFLGDYLIFTIVLAGALVLAERELVYRALAVAGLLIGLLAQLATLSRASWIGVLVGLGILVVGLSRKRVRVWRWVAIGTIVVVLGVTLLSIASPFNPVQRVAVAFQGGDPFSGRLDIWRAGWQAFLDRPIFGAGLSDFVYAAAPYAVATPEGIPDRAHDYPLQLLVTTGVPGLLLGSAFVFVTLASSAGPAFKRADASPRGVLYLAAWASVVGYFVALLAAISLPGTSAFAWLAFGLLAHPSSTKVEIPDGWIRWAVVSAAAAALVLAVVMLGRIGTADWAFMRARDAARRGGANRLAFARLAVRLHPLPERYRAELGDAERAQP